MKISEQIAVMQAFEAGQKIEMKHKMIEAGSWAFESNPLFNWADFDYRVMEDSFVPYQDLKAEIEVDGKRLCGKFTRIAIDYNEYIWAFVGLDSRCLVETHWESDEEIELNTLYSSFNGESFQFHTLLK